MIPVALTIAGSDPSGGAGIQADLKTFHQFGVYGQSVITLITAQNTEGVRRVEPLSPALVIEQLETLLSDIAPHAAKTGALGDASIAAALGRAASRFSFPLIVDPVLASKNGARLGEPAFRELLPYAALLTPNLTEAAALTNSPVESLDDMRRAARGLQSLGAQAVLVKGGHLAQGPAIDLLLTSDGFTEFETPRYDTPHTHGTGCTYSAAITALTACGLALPEAVGRAKDYIGNAIRTAPALGRGRGPVNHWA